MIIYHCNQSILNPGDLIAPGTWLQQLIDAGPTHPFWRREMMLETIRMKYYDDKPSRLFSTFGFMDVESITLYRSIHMPDAYLYRVEHTDATFPCHRGDYQDIDPGGLTTSHLSTVALRYWEYGHRTKVQDWELIKGSEIISASSVRVLKAIH